MIGECNNLVKQDGKLLKSFMQQNRSKREGNENAQKQSVSMYDSKDAKTEMLDEHGNNETKVKSCKMTQKETR